MTCPRPGLALLVALLTSSCHRTATPRDSLAILLTDDILSVDPNAQVEQVTDSVLFNVFEPLVGFDEDLQLRTILAESWEHPEPERWRFHLRRDVRFHDGAPLTAETVRDALLAVKNAPQLEASHFLSQIEEIVAVAPHTVDIVTLEPRAILASLPFVYVARPNSLGTFPPLVGTGPYRLEEWVRGKRVVLGRADGYWGPQSGVRKATFVPVPDPEERVARLREGTADIVYRVPPELANPAPGARFPRRAGLTVTYLGFDLRPKPGNPFLDARVRRAFHLAVDREGLVERGLAGKGAVSNQPVAPLVFGYNPDLPRPARDPERARQLMAEAGHAKGFKVRLDFSVGRLPAPGIVQDSLRQIGVDVDMNPLGREAFFKLIDSGGSAFFLAGWDCSSGEASEFYEFLLHTPDERHGRGNSGAYSNRRIDEIAETNSAILDPRARKRLLQEAAAIVMEDLPVLPLFVSDIIHGAREDVGFPPRADGEIKLTDVTWGATGDAGKAR